MMQARKMVERKPAQHTAGLSSFLPRNTSSTPEMSRNTPKKSEYLARYSHNSLTLNLLQAALLTMST